MKNSVQGFSLIEVMVTMSIMMVIALGMAAFMNQQAKEQNNVKAKATYQSLVTSVQSAASNPRAVTDSADGMVTQTVSIPIKNINDSISAAQPMQFSQ